MTATVDALSAWADYPASSTPRPVVLVDGYVRVGSSGFVGGDAKLAFVAGAIDSQVEIPDGVRELLPPPAGGPPDRSGPRITVTAIRRSQATFLTDRGRRTLPTYAVAFDGTREPVQVLDPAVPVWWPKRPTPDGIANGSATIEADGLTLHVPAMGGVLTEFLGCRFTESDTAVLAQPLTRERDAEGAAVPAVGICVQVSGRLAGPLGPRVLVDTDGLPLAVLPA